MALMPHSWWIAQSKGLRHSRFGLSRDFCDRCFTLFTLVPLGQRQVDLDFFCLVSFDSEEFRVPGVASHSWFCNRRG
jgi:hypothetical protein